MVEELGLALGTLVADDVAEPLGLVPTLGLDEPVTLGEEPEGDELGDSVGEVGADELGGSLASLDDDSDGEPDSEAAVGEAEGSTRGPWSSSMISRI